MKTLVTGAPGWLGSRLVERLLAEGNAVRALVEPSQDPTPLEGLGIEVVAGDVRDPSVVGRACSGVAQILHCAGIVHAPRFSDYRSVHVGGTTNLLRAGAASGATRFVYVSTEAAQGYNPDSRPLTEDMPCRPETEYGRTKRDAELEVLRANRSGGFETVVVRPAMFYGPGQPERRSRLMRMVASARPPLFGDGLNRRSMVYLENLVDALFAVRLARDIGGELFWIADTEIYTTLGIFESMAAALEVPLHPLRLPERLATACRVGSRTLERLHLHSLDLHVVGESPRDFFCSNAKARARLGWQPRVDLATGMRAAVDAWRALEGATAHATAKALD